VQKTCEMLSGLIQTNLKLEQASFIFPSQYRWDKS
jgi:hypothetical protein